MPEHNIPRKPEHSSIKGICVLCNTRPQVSKGAKAFRAVCNKCHCKNQNKSSNGRRYSRHKKETCEKCGFIPIDSCQLDVDHIDGNHKNNEKNNLQTLCANCHRLKTYQSRDWE
jgi:hypothetical protein